MLLNPFNRIAGFSALFYGGLGMLLTAMIAAPCGVNFVGSLNIHVARPMPFELIFGLLVLGWLNVSFFFFVAGRFFSKSNIRLIDVGGTLALARLPFLIAAPFGLLPGLWNLNVQQQLPAETAISLTIACIVFLLVDIWVVVLSYNAFAVSTNVKNKWLFAAVLIASEIAAIILSGLLAACFPLPPLPVDEPVKVVVDLTTVPIPEDAEHVEIARQFVERVFSGANDDPLEQFEVTDAMKPFVTADSFKHWTRAIVVTDYGKPVDVAKVEVVPHNQLKRSVYLYFHCERYPIKMWVTFENKAIAGFHWDWWRDEMHEKSEESRTVLPIVVTAFIPPVLLILIIFVGEKWRNRWVEERNRRLEPFDVERTIGTVYRESQNPLWMYLLFFALLLAVSLPFLLGKRSFFERSDTIVILGTSGAILTLVALLLVGLFVEVGDESADVRMGIMRIRILRFPFDSIASVEVVPLRPLRDFGGWGPYRFGRNNTIGCFMSGTCGVLIQTDKGKKYLLGSDTPDRLAAVLRSRMGKP
ncbi:MAG: hypothetical protein FWC43_05240 [Planctomycetaceae bacterium]|nr:hypothetical protein [Planctomycetaceae bacterium]